VKSDQNDKTIHQTLGRISFEGGELKEGGKRGKINEKLEKL